MKESELASTLGIPRETIARHRRAHLDETIHWTCSPGLPVIYTDDGIARMRKQFELEETPAAADMVQGTVRGFPRNDRLLQVEYEDRLVLCRVRRRELYVKGMEIPMMPLISVGGSEMYEVRGHPRRKGRWE